MSSSDIKKTLPEFEVSNTPTLSNLETVPEESTEIQASVFYEDVNDKNFSDDGFCGFSDDDDEGYYYDLNTGETYTKSEYRYSIRAY